MLHALKHTAQVQYYHNLINEKKASITTMWKTFGPMLNPTKHKPTAINKLLVNNIAYTKNKDIARIFNEYFINIGKELSETFPKDANFSQYLGPSNPHTLFLSPVSTQEMSKELMKINARKFTGPDNAMPKLIKECSDILAEPLSHIVNLSFQNGVFPNPLKLAKVIPIYKKKKIPS